MAYFAEPILLQIYMTSQKRKSSDGAEFVLIPRSAVLCTICSGIMHHPHHLNCNCTVSFCKTCISQWMQTNEKCPLCNVKASVILPCGRQWSDALDSIKRTCPNSDKCRFKRGTYAEAKNHAAQECMFRKIQCPNEECDEIIMHKNLKEHLRLCRLKRCKNCITSQYGCTVMGTSEFIKQHELRCVFSPEVLKQIGELVEKIKKTEESV
jgi:hypothetical protein